MPSLTDGQIRNAIKRVEKTRKQETLTDGEGRGTGRLLLIIKAMPTRVVSNWYAQQWISNKRRLSKMGDYPHMSLAEARTIFERDYATAINKGASIKVQGDARPGTVADLFDAYVDHLKSQGKMSWVDTKKSLDKITDQFGRNRLAREIEPEDVLNVLRPIYERGKRSMADHMRAYIRAAFSWGLKSELDYRNPSPRRFRLIHNPAGSIPTEPKVVGTRWLDEPEWCQLWWWLENPDRPVHEPYLRAMQLLMLTGQRVQEICTLHVDQYDREERLLDWSRTKNGKPHTIPLPQMAVDLLESLTPSKEGWFFPKMTDASKPVEHGTVYSFLWRQRDRGVVPLVTNRDLRRTWKTLGGKAGLTKEIRDRMQNHANFDVSSRHYDRYNYLDEKREAMEIWDRFMRDMLERYPKPRAKVLKAA